jgi:hypothetical protein
MQSRHDYYSYSYSYSLLKTFYKKRTVEEIMARKGGNCNELAMVTMALLKELRLQMRKVREINIHKESARRRESAHQKVLDNGNRFSVFGKRHYVIEGLNRIYDDKLINLKSWESWKSSIDALDEKCWGAFLGEINLHDYENSIDSLAVIYNNLKAEYLAHAPGVAH